MRLTVDSLKLIEEGSKSMPPLVFCKRVRNLLIANDLDKHSFLESVEGTENKGVNFLPFGVKKEKNEVETSR